MIELLDNYVLDVDDHCYTLKQDTGKTDKRGNRVYKTLGYFGDVTGALHALVKELAREKHKHACTSLNEAVNAIREDNTRVENLIKTEIGEND